MTKVDHFESQFRAAEREPFRYEPPVFRRILFVTDLSGEEARSLEQRIKGFLAHLPIGTAEAGDQDWALVLGENFHTEKELLDLVEKHEPDLVVTYRHLHSEGWRWHYSLGEYVDVLVGATDLPVLLLPHPRAGLEADHSLLDTNRVMVMTDHLTGAHRLVNCGVAFCQARGRLILSHLEDQATFEHYVKTFGKIPSIDTENARDALREQLIKEPEDYIESCRSLLEQERPSLEIQAIVGFGKRLPTYRALIEEHEVDLLVLNATKDDQLAMRGLVYPLAVGLRHIPLALI